MKTLKKILVVILMIVMIFVLSGCDEQVDKGDDNEVITYLTNKDKKDSTTNSSSNNENENEDDNGSNIINEKDVAKIDELMIQCLNTTNTNNILECTEYLKHLPIELIEYGLRKTARKQYPSWQYAMTILDDYVRKKFTTIAQVKADELGYKSQVKKKTAEEEFLNEQD